MRVNRLQIISQELCPLIRLKRTRVKKGEATDVEGSSGVDVNVAAVKYALQVIVLNTNGCLDNEKQRDFIAISMLRMVIYVETRTENGTFLQDDALMFRNFQW